MTSCSESSIAGSNSGSPQLQPNEDPPMNEQLVGLALGTAAADEANQSKFKPHFPKDTIDESTTPDPSKREVDAFGFPIVSPKPKKNHTLRYPIEDLISITNQIANDVKINCELLAEGFEVGQGMSGELEDKMVKMMGLFIEASTTSVNMMLALIAMIKAAREENARNKEREGQGE